MRKRCLDITCIAVLLSVMNTSTRATIIDTFDAQQPNISVNGFSLNGSAVSHPDILGGQRDMGMAGGAKSIGVATVGVYGGAVQFDASGQTGANANQPVLFALEYDGSSDGGNAFGGVSNGLGSVDLTNGGTANAMIMCFQYLDYNFSAGSSNFGVHLIDMDDRQAFITFRNVDLRSSSPFTLIFPFTNPPESSTIAPGFRFDAVGFVRLQLIAHEMQFRLSSLSTGTESRNACSFVGPCNEVDANNDGRIDLADHGTFTNCFDGVAACGNGIRESEEECDGMDDETCPGACLSDCTCSELSCGDEGTGDCCNIAGKESPRCANAGCCSAVCEVDPFCCDSQWDALCALQATISFANACECPPSDCGNGIAEPGEECDGLDDLACPGLCAEDCTCGSICGNPSAGSCCEESPEPDAVGCSDATCCEAVCAFEPMCCSETWDLICVDLAVFQFSKECGCP